MNSKRITQKRKKNLLTKVLVKGFGWNKQLMIKIIRDSGPFQSIGYLEKFRKKYWTEYRYL